MNERIKTMCQEAFTEAHESRIGPDGLVRSDGNPYIFYEKLAELIVKECMEVVIDGQYSAVECHGNSHRISYNNGRTGASSDIKKHFGVKE